jgi:hypothetical protein
VCSAQHPDNREDKHANADPCNHSLCTTRVYDASPAATERDECRRWGRCQTAWHGGYCKPGSWISMISHSHLARSHGHTTQRLASWNLNGGQRPAANQRLLYPLSPLGRARPVTHAVRFPNRIPFDAGPFYCHPVKACLTNTGGCRIRPNIASHLGTRARVGVTMSSCSEDQKQLDLSRPHNHPAPFKLLRPHPRVHTCLYAHETLLVRA